MLYNGIIAVCSEFLAKHINALRGQNAENFLLYFEEPTVTTGIWRGKISSDISFP